jgi:hypothetical protein
MTTYDAVLLLAIVVWWLMFRRKYDWRAVVFYIGGVLVVDILCALVILVAYRSHPPSSPYLPC